MSFLLFKMRIAIDSIRTHYSHSNSTCHFKFILMGHYYAVIFTIFQFLFLITRRNFRLIIYFIIIMVCVSFSPFFVIPFHLFLISCMDSTEIWINTAHHIVKSKQINVCNSPSWVVNPKYTAVEIDLSNMPYLHLDTSWWWLCSLVLINYLLNPNHSSSSCNVIFAVAVPDKLVHHLFAPVSGG